MENIKKVKYNGLDIYLISIEEWSNKYRKDGYPKGYIKTSFNTEDALNYDIDIKSEVKFKQNVINIYFNEESLDFIKSVVLEKTFILEQEGDFKLFSDVQSYITKGNSRLYGNFDYQLSIRSKVFFSLDSKCYTYSNFLSKYSEIDINEISDHKNIDKSGIIKKVIYKGETIYLFDYNMNNIDFDSYKNYPDNTLNLSSATKRSRYSKKDYDKDYDKIFFDTHYHYITFNDSNIKLILPILSIKKYIIQYDNKVYLHNKIEGIKISTTDTESNMNLSLSITNNPILNFKETCYKEEGSYKFISYKDIKF